MGLYGDAECTLATWVLHDSPNTNATIMILKTEWGLVWKHDVTPFLHTASYLDPHHSGYSCLCSVKSSRSYDHRADKQHRKIILADTYCLANHLISWFKARDMALRSIKAVRMSFLSSSLLVIAGCWNLARHMTFLNPWIPYSADSHRISVNAGCDTINCNLGRLQFDRYRSQTCAGKISSSYTRHHTNFSSSKSIQMHFVYEKPAE